jgi:Ca-activated chloride channel homolog
MMPRSSTSPLNVKLPSPARSLHFVSQYAYTPVEKRENGRMLHRAAWSVVTRSVLLCLLLLPAGTLARAQDGPLARTQEDSVAHKPAVAAKDPDPPYSIRVNTTYVLIPVTVTDDQNRFVLGLGRSNFGLSEDGNDQKITQVSGEDAPLSVGLLVDTSGSMGMKLDLSRHAVQEFLKTINPADEAFLVEFSDRARLVTGFTNRVETIQDGLASLDAVNIGLHEMKSAKNPRKALLILSDGGDNNSRYTPGEIKDLVREADVQIYCMGVFEPTLMGLSLAELSGPRLLARISDQTGGRVFAATRDSQLPAIAKRIGVELRNQYVLAYYPSHNQRDGTYRRVTVKLKPPEGLPPLKARWRLGYYAPSQQ